MHDQRTIERFWSKVDKRGPDECWEWLDKKAPDGYGQFRVSGRCAQAHRISWELHNGSIPEGVFICHLCDNRGCVNPRHLLLGTPAGRFWAKVDKRGPDDCWEWKESVRRGGYGAFGVNKKVVSAHRFSWEMHNGPIPEGMFVCHTCDNPLCVNPNHLFLGTHSDNMADAANKDRMRRWERARGESHGNAKLTEDQVYEIRDDTRMPKEIAKEYGVNGPAVSKIQLRRSWKHLPERERADEDEVEPCPN